VQPHLPTCSSSKGFTSSIPCLWAAVLSTAFWRSASAQIWSCRGGLVCEDDATRLTKRARVASPCAFSLSPAKDRARVCGSRLSVWRRDQPTDFGELSVGLFGALSRISPSCFLAGTLILPLCFFSSLLCYLGVGNNNNTYL
jgi:hypothetical protein